MQTPNDQETLAHLAKVQERYADLLMQKAHVLGVGIGLRHCGGINTEESCLVVLVDQKVPPEYLAEEDRIPDQVDGVRIDVQEVGTISAQSGW